MLYDLCRGGQGLIFTYLFCSLRLVEETGTESERLDCETSELQGIELPPMNEVDTYSRSARKRLLSQVIH